MADMTRSGRFQVVPVPDEPAQEQRQPPFASLGSQTTPSAAGGPGYNGHPASEPTRVLAYDPSHFPAAVQVPRARSVPPTAQPLPQTPLDVWSSELPSDLDPRLVLLKEPYSPRAASFRALRHRLAGREERVIAVTSAMPREGKTTCAVNLALALAENGGAKVLLVEANVRTPELARLLGFAPPDGFAAQMTRHRESPRDPWAVVELSGTEARIHVLAIDEQSALPPVLDHVGFSIAIDRLRHAGYDFIVIDTPSVLETADVHLIVDAVDGVVVTALAKKSTGRALSRAIEQLAPATILGAVLIEG